jgi:hypothetical protein
MPTTLTISPAAELLALGAVSVILGLGSAIVGVRLSEHRIVGGIVLVIAGAAFCLGFAALGVGLHQVLK